MSEIQGQVKLASGGKGVLGSKPKCESSHR